MDVRRVDGEKVYSLKLGDWSFVDTRKKLKYTSQLADSAKSLKRAPLKAVTGVYV